MSSHPLLILCALLSLSVPALGSPDLSLTPGSGQMPLKAISFETPPPPKGKRVSPVTVGLWLNDRGLVVKADLLSGCEAWNDAVLEAAKGWRFEPPLLDGKPIPSRTVATVRLYDPKTSMGELASLPNFPSELHNEDEFGVTKPKLRKDPDLRLPLLARACRGTVEAGFRYVIEPDGSTGSFELLGANSESAYRAVLDELANQQYEPAKVDGTCVRFACKQVISVTSTEKVHPALEGLREALEPIYPYEELIASTEGSAKVKFTLSAEGLVSTAEITEATSPAFGQALKAAIESWSFLPQSATSSPQREYEYAFRADDLPGSLARLASARRLGAEIDGPKGLDGRLERAYAPGLAYPLEFSANRISGSALVEIIIDRHGLVQMPRILKASAPAFGWSAATWLAGMRFKAPLRNGQATEVRVSIPVNFKLPEQDNVAAKPASSSGT